MKNGKRDYRREYDLYVSKHIDDVAKRVQARRDVIKKVGKSAVAGKDIDHRQPLSKGGSNKMANFRITSVSRNRSFSRNPDGSLKSQTSKKERKK